MDNNYAIINGKRYEVINIEDRDTFDVIDGVCYGYLTIGVTYRDDDE